MSNDESAGRPSAWDATIKKFQDAAKSPEKSFEDRLNRLSERQLLQFLETAHEQAKSNVRGGAQDYFVIASCCVRRGIQMPKHMRALLADALAVLSASASLSRRALNRKGRHKPRASISKQIEIAEYINSLVKGGANIKRRTSSARRNPAAAKLEAERNPTAIQQAAKRFNVSEGTAENAWRKFRKSFAYGKE